MVAVRFVTVTKTTLTIDGGCSFCDSNQKHSPLMVAVRFDSNQKHSPLMVAVRFVTVTKKHSPLMVAVRFVTVTKNTHH
jgi:hypothetical protein